MGCERAYPAPPAFAVRIISAIALVRDGMAEFSEIKRLDLLFLPNAEQIEIVSTEKSVSSSHHVIPSSVNEGALS